MKGKTSSSAQFSVHGYLAIPVKRTMIAKRHGARVIHYDMLLGNDVPRAVGAMAAGDADIFLFTDADMVIPTEELLPLIKSIESGYDHAINTIDWCARYPVPDAPSVARYFLQFRMAKKVKRVAISYESKG